MAAPISDSVAQLPMPAGRISASRAPESCKLSKADRRSHAEIVVAAPLCWGVLLSPEHGSRRALHRLGERGVPWLQPATFGRPASLCRRLLSVSLHPIDFEGEDSGLLVCKLKSKSFDF